MAQDLKALFAPRPLWMNALFVFCVYMTVIYVPWDLFLKPVENDQEVWFGILFTGWWAKALTPFHWAVYAAGAWGFHKMAPWMWPWAAVYVAQIAIGMLVWSLLNMNGVLAVLMGLVSFAAFAALARALWQAKPHFQPGAGA